jgi:hypothetical protein
MRSQLAIAAVIAATALSASAQPRSEANSPFTYEAVGATPSLALNFGRKAAPVAAANAAEAPKPGAATGTATAPRATAGGVFTYDALGATPHVELKKHPATEIVTRQPAR